VTLSDETSAEAVCTIFETLNRTGVKLSPFELLTARFWPKGINLRELWDNARADFPIIAQFDVDPYYLLQAVALVSRAAPSCKRKDVLELSVDAIKEWWDRCVGGLAAGLQMLRDDCGVIVPKWLPYGTILIPLAAAFAKLTAKGPDVGVQRLLLKRWFWCSVFGQTYENATNTQAANDLSQLLDWFAGNDGPESVRSFQFVPSILRETTVRQRALYRGIIALVLSRDALDFHTQKKITRELALAGDVDDHHIFPQAFLSRTRPDLEARQRDCVLNRTLIDATTNKLISDRAPSRYLADIAERFNKVGPSELPRVLRSHVLPPDSDSPLWFDDFDSFLDWRQSKLSELIDKATGG
jgi:hypothetical protein